MKADEEDGRLADPQFMPSVLVVDDDTDMITMVERIVSRKMRCRILKANSGHEALEIIEKHRPDVLVTDIKMPEMDGLALLSAVSRQFPDISVILMTGYGTVEMAVQALREGAYDFIEKPFDKDRLLHTIQRCLERVTLLRENQTLQERLTGKGDFHGFVGRSPRLGEVFELISRVADTDVTVLIRGESGTGKELAARALHAMSSRAAKTMVTVNCPALPEHVLESELFGYARGAFTGANHDKKGLFLEANGSTILLDEIGDMPMTLQTKLLRVLQEKEIMPLGQTKSIKVDVRVLASTNQNLEAKIRQGRFREDLFYRLNVVTVTMPPLSERPEDIPLLAQHFLEKFREEYGRSRLSFAPDILRYLMKKNWKGNVRELQNVVKRSVLLASGSQIEVADLGSVSVNDAAPGNFMASLQHLSYNDAKQEVLERFSAAYLAQSLQQSAGNVTAAAHASGLGRQAFQRLLRRFGLEAESFRTGLDAKPGE